MTDFIADALRAPAPEAADAARRFAERAAAEGVADLAYATTDSPLGELLLVSGPRGLTRLAYIDGELDALLDELAQTRSPRIVASTTTLDPWRRELDEYFGGHRRDFGAPLDWAQMAPFQRRILRATAAIPYGNVSSYRAVAADAGSPRGFRAAGNALGANPLPIVVPCHRVLH
ncbi:MAG: methylated-DNA--[protein]-cysteine S-methyltransferase, partial [Solirubrobacteraceae bacterium]